MGRTRKSGRGARGKASQIEKQEVKPCVGECLENQKFCLHNNGQRCADYMPKVRLSCFMNLSPQDRYYLHWKDVI